MFDLMKINEAYENMQIKEPDLSTVTTSQEQKQTHSDDDIILSKQTPSQSAINNEDPDVDAEELADIKRTEQIQNELMNRGRSIRIPTIKGKRSFTPVTPGTGIMSDLFKAVRQRSSGLSGADLFKAVKDYYSHNDEQQSQSSANSTNKVNENADDMHTAHDVNVVFVRRGGESMVDGYDARFYPTEPDVVTVFGFKRDDGSYGIVMNAYADGRPIQSGASVYSYDDASEYEKEIRYVLSYWQKNGYEGKDYPSRREADASLSSHMEAKPYIEISYETSSLQGFSYKSANYSTTMHSSFVKPTAEEAAKEMLDIIKQNNCSKYIFDYEKDTSWMPPQIVLRTRYDGRRPPKNQIEFTFDKSDIRDRKIIIEFLRSNGVRIAVPGQTRLTEEYDGYDGYGVDDENWRDGGGLEFVRQQVASARAKEEYYCVAYPYPDISNDAEFLGSSKNLKEMVALAKEQASDYDCINVCDPEGYVVRAIGNDGGDYNTTDEY